jgi:hypothetical protein
MSRRPSPTTIIACTALFFSLAGTGLAASRYIITSTSQIKPSVRRALHGAEGARGITGPQGLQGPQGLRGPEGQRGAEANLERLCAGIGQAYSRVPIEGAPYDGSRQALSVALFEIYTSACK